MEIEVSNKQLTKEAGELFMLTLEYRDFLRAIINDNELWESRKEILHTRHNLAKKLELINTKIARITYKMNGGK